MAGESLWGGRASGAWADIEVACLRCYNNASRVPNLLQVLATEFVEIPCEVLFGDAERVGGELGAKGAEAGEGLREGRG